MPVGENTHGWLAAAFAPGIGDRLRRELACAGPVTDAGRLEAWPAALAARIPGLAGRLAAGRSDPRTAATLDWLTDPRHHLLALDDPAYPPLLREIDDAPPLLYAAGHVGLLQRPALAMVGSRNPSALGAQTAEVFARGFSRAGLTVASGLALGIDAAAHRGALDGAGSTIAVVGTGLDIVYPARNRELAHRIAASGVLVSEFPLGLSARSDHFPRRNRILSGLALGCLVVEANLRSGSLITARLAAEQGREVFAIPGSIHSPLAKGCHLLIRQGAKLTESAADVIQELGWGQAGTLAPPAAGREPAGAELVGDPLALLAVVGYDPISADTLGSQLGWTPQRVSAALAELELSGRVASAGHGAFQRLADPGADFAWPP
jgi:DNA processing protein